MASAFRNIFGSWTPGVCILYKVFSVLALSQRGVNILCGPLRLSPKFCVYTLRWHGILWMMWLMLFWYACKVFISSNTFLWHQGLKLGVWVIPRGVTHLTHSLSTKVTLLSLTQWVLQGSCSIQYCTQMSTSCWHIMPSSVDMDLICYYPKLIWWYNQFVLCYHSYISVTYCLFDI